MKYFVLKFAKSGKDGMNFSKTITLSQADMIDYAQYATGIKYSI